MTASIKDQIKSKMKDKGTEELLNIWRVNDRSTYAAEAFDAVADILQDRGVEVPSQPHTARPGQHPEQGVVATNVVVTDVQMPFTSMVEFMVKWAIASIPAALILTVLAVIGFALLGGVLGGLFTALKR
jgi:hypothetical protein